MILRFRPILLIFVLTLLVTACNREDDYVTPPQISMSSPFTDQIFGFGDTVFIKAEIHHFRNVVSVKVSVLNEQLSPALPVLNFDANSIDYQLNTFIVFDDIALKSGKYSLQIKISDIDHVWNEWVDIHFVEAEKELLSLIAVARQTVNSFRVLEQPVDGSFSQLYDFQGDFLSSNVNSLKNTLFTAGSVYNGLDAYDLKNRKLIWEIPAVVNPPQPWCYGLFSDDKNVFVSTRDGYINGFDNEGRATFRNEKVENGIFRKFISHKSKIIAVHEPYNQQFSEIFVFNYPGGTVLNSTKISGHVVHLAEYSENSVLIFVNGSGNAAVYEFNVENLLFVKLKTFSFLVIDDVISSKTNHYFILSANEIHWFRPDQSGITSYLNVYQPVALAFDDLNNILYVASDNNINSYRIPFSQPVQQWSMPFEIVSLNLRYNK